MWRQLWQTLMLALALAAPGPVAVGAQEGPRCFAETGFCVEGRIRQFWERGGGLPVFGLPIGPQQEELVEGRPRQVQWFERARLELHPENAPPYDVLLGRLGVDRLAQQGRPDWQQFRRAAARGDCETFATGHSVCGPFLAAWRSSGLELDGRPGFSSAESLALLGQPISAPGPEVIEGRAYSVQWFERARLELHPGHAPPADVLLGRLGSEVLADAGAVLLSPSGGVEQLTAALGRLFFTHHSPATGAELWVSDGTAEGTRLLKDIIPGPEGSVPMELVELNGALLFRASSAAGAGHTLWRSDGTAEGTAELLPAARVADVWHLTRVGGTVFFIGTDRAHGEELWATDGTAAGTRLVREIYPGERGIHPAGGVPMGYRTYDLTPADGWLYFHAEAPGLGYGIWRSDGTAAGTTFVTNLGMPDRAPEYWDLTGFGAGALFVARTGPLTYGVYGTDGTAEGTRLLLDVSYRQDPRSLRLFPQVRGLEVVGGEGYFSFQGRLWSTDGTPEGTRQRSRLIPGDLEGLGGAAYFLGLDEAAGEDLSRAGGAASAEVVAAVAPTLAMGRGYPGGRMHALGERLFIGLNGGERRAELWVSDGTAAGTAPLASWRGYIFGSIGDATRLGRVTAALDGRLYFALENAVSGSELWASDGTPAGTVMVARLSRG